MDGIPNPGRTLSAREVAHLLDVSERTLWRMIAEGKFSRPRVPAKGRRCWFEADVAVYRYRLMRGDFDPPGPGEEGPPPEGDEDLDEGE
jgi:excisionase family DNA binding protein